MLRTTENVMGNKDITVAARFNAEDAQELQEIAEVLDIPAAQIIREAVREKVDRLNRTHPKLKNRPEAIAGTVAA